MTYYSSRLLAYERLNAPAYSLAPPALLRGEFPPDENDYDGDVLAYSAGVQIARLTRDANLEARLRSGELRCPLEAPLMHCARMLVPILDPACLMHQYPLLPAKDDTALRRLQRMQPTPPADVDALCSHALAAVEYRHHALALIRMQERQAMHAPLAHQDFWETLPGRCQLIHNLLALTRDAWQRYLDALAALAPPHRDPAHYSLAQLYTDLFANTDDADADSPA